MKRGKYCRLEIAAELELVMCGMEKNFPQFFFFLMTQNDFHGKLPIQSHDKCRSAAVSFIVNHKNWKCSGIKNAALNGTFVMFSCFNSFFLFFSRDYLSHHNSHKEPALPFHMNMMKQFNNCNKNLNFSITINRKAEKQLYFLPEY